jgi:hypothetical protein
MVTVDAGQLTHAPWSSTVTTPLSCSTPTRDVAAVGLDRRAHDLDDLFDLGQFHLGLHAVLSARSVGDAPTPAPMMLRRCASDNPPG